MDQQQLQDMLEKMGSVGVLLPAAAFVAGLILLLLGSKLARPMCAFSGLVLGGVGGLVLGEALADAGGVMLALVIGMAIAGALLSALLFRVWMAISGALIFGLAAAGAVLLWQAPPESVTNLTGQTEAADADESADDEDGLKIDLPVDEITDKLRKTVADVIEGGGEEGEASELSAQITIDKETAQKAWSVILEALRGMASYYRQTLSDWWAEAGTGARGTMLLVGLVAAAVGLLLGLLAPYRAASVQSAVAGAVLILFSSFSLLAQLMPEHLTWLPATPRGVLICLGLITAVGLALQWTIFARKTDK
jgi:hypothetical protein